MVLRPYVASLAVDGVTLEGAPGATGEVYAKGDTAFTTPLATVDASGLPVVLTANSRSVLPSFFVEGETAVVWKSGDWVFPLVTSEPVPGQPGEQGVGIQNVSASGDQMTVNLTDGTELAPITLPTGPGGSNEGVAEYITTDGPTKTALSSTFARIIGLEGRGVSHLNTAGVNTPLIQAAMDEAEGTGAVVVFPPTPAGAFIDVNAPIVVRGGHSIRGAGAQVTRIRQTVFPHMIFDVIGPDVEVSDLGGWQDIAKFAEGPNFAGQFRGGSPYYTFNAVVWAGADRVRVHDVHAEGFVAAVNFASWDVATNAARTALLDCSAENVTVSKVVFGLVAAGVERFSYSNLSGDYYLPAGIGTPPHLVYFVEFRAPNVDVTGGPCHATDGQSSYAYQFKGVYGGKFSKQVARRCRGFLHTMYCEDLTFTDSAGYEDTWLTELAGSVEIEATNKNIVIKGLTLNLTGTGKPVRFSADTTDSILKNATIISNHTVAATSSTSYDVDIQGANNTAENVSVTNIGPEPWPASIGDWAGAGHTIRRPRTSGNQVGVTVRPRLVAANTRIEDYDLADLGSTLALPLTIGSAADLSPRPKFTARMGMNRLIAYDDGSLPANSVGVITRTPSGHLWVQDFGTWAADGSHIYATSGASATATLDLGVANVDASAGLRYKNREALALRVIDKNNLLAVRLNHATNVYELVGFNSGAGTVLASAPMPVAIGRRYEIRATIYGNVVDAYLDGRWLFTHTLGAADAAKFVGTKHGLMSATGDPDGKFDNIAYRSLT